MQRAESDYTDDLFRFLDNSPSAYHAVHQMEQRLLAAGFARLDENNYWHLEHGRGYFLEREGALVAFILGSEERVDHGFRMMASHSDSPGLKLKPKPLYSSPPNLQLGVEVYGGPLLATWFDRDLSLAGRVTLLLADGTLADFLIDFRRPLLTIPSLAIHFDREANNGRAIDKQKSLPPLLAQSINGQLPAFTEIILAQLTAEYPESKHGQLLGFDLFCYDPQPPSHLGLSGEFILGGRLDNLLSCHVATTAICGADRRHNALFLCTNHEEIGSTSQSGAGGSLVDSVVMRLLPEPEQRQICMRRSFLVSLDNAHAVHPNARDKSDPAHDVQLNGGPVIKINGNQRYATNSRSAALFRVIAQEAAVPVQDFVMRSDLPCGSTIGPMTAARLGVETIDVGAPTLAMHSIREMTGARDPFLMLEVIRKFIASGSILRRG